MEHSGERKRGEPEYSLVEGRRRPSRKKERNIIARHECGSGLPDTKHSRVFRVRVCKVTWRDRRDKYALRRTYIHAAKNRVYRANVSQETLINVSCTFANERNETVFRGGYSFAGGVELCFSEIFSGCLWKKPGSQGTVTF